MAIFLFNFKREFASAVEQGTKRQTIRATRADGRRPKVGDQVKLYTSLRTRNARLLKASTVTAVMSVRLIHKFGEVIVDGERFLTHQADVFAQADGFASKAAMLTWFREQYLGADFEGFCVQWEA